MKTLRGPREKVRLISDTDEKRTILGLMDITEHDFGFDFALSGNGRVVEVSMVSAGLVSIPRGLARLRYLYRVQLQSNSIRRLRNLDRCASVQIINLSDNQISSSELGRLKTLKNLKTIDLTYNKLDSLAPLQDFSVLEIFKAQNNKITEIPPLPSLKDLKILDLEGNPIGELKNIHHLNSLYRLNLKKSDLDEEEKAILDKGIKKVKQYCRNKGK